MFTQKKVRRINVTKKQIFGISAFFEFVRGVLELKSDPYHYDVKKRTPKLNNLLYMIRYPRNGLQ